MVERFTDHAGLPDGYRGAAGPLLEAIGVDLNEPGEALTAVLRKVQR
jgi:hypothetical protein